MWDTIDNCFSDHTQLNSGLLWSRSWTNHYCSSIPQLSSQISAPAVPLACALVLQTRPHVDTTQPHPSHSNSHPTPSPEYVQTYHVYNTNTTVNPGWHTGIYLLTLFLPHFMLLLMGSCLNLADFSQELSRRIWATHFACPATGTTASRLNLSK